MEYTDSTGLVVFHWARGVSYVIICYPFKLDGSKLYKKFNMEEEEDEVFAQL